MAERSKQFYARIAVTAVAVILVMIVAKLLFFTGSQAGRNERRAASSSTKVISWQDAAKHYGEYCTVEGTVVATHNSGKACFLNFHPNWKKYSTAVIFANRFGAFPSNPEDYYRGKKVRVTGTVKEYEGKPEIILESLSQIEIVE